MFSLFVTLARLARMIVRSARDPEFRALLLAFALMLMGGTVFYVSVEEWTVLDAIYFCVATLSTVGYGDVVPVTPLGKIFTIFYIVSGIGVFIALAAKLAAAVIQRPKD